MNLGRGWVVTDGTLRVEDGAEIPPVVCLHTGATADVVSARTKVRHETAGDVLATLVARGVDLWYGRSDVALVSHGLGRARRLRRRVGWGIMGAATLLLPGGLLLGELVGESGIGLIGMLAFIVGTIAGDAVRGHELRAMQMDDDGLLEVPCHPRAIEILAALQLDDEDDDDDEEYDQEDYDQRR